MINLTPAMLDAATRAYEVAEGILDPEPLEAALKAALELADKPAPRGAYGKRRLMLFYSYGRGLGRNDMTLEPGTVITGKLLSDWEQVIKERYGYLQVVVTGWQMLEG